MMMLEIPVLDSFAVTELELPVVCNLSLSLFNIGLLLVATVPRVRLFIHQLGCKCTRHDEAESLVSPDD